MRTGSQAPGNALPADWQARLRAGVLRTPDSDPASTLKPAAVLLPIVDYADGARLLLTERAPHLRKHAGQISYPGGNLAPGDIDLTAAALRETEEEVGIQTSFIEPLGFLPDRIVPSGYRVTPVVALLRPGFVLRLDPTEVAGTFELPLALALDQGNYRSRRRVLKGVEVISWDLPFAEHNIWGATAAILRDLAAVLRGNPL